MTETDWPMFERLMLGLAMATNYALDDADRWAQKCGEYFRACSDLSLEAVSAGMDTLKQESRFFPAIVAIRQSAQEWVERERRFRHVDERREHWDDCSVCGDTGWIPKECPADPCGRVRQHGPHSFVSPCPCRRTNPTYQRRRSYERTTTATQAMRRQPRQEHTR